MLIQDQSEILVGSERVGHGLQLPGKYDRSIAWCGGVIAVLLAEKQMDYCCNAGASHPARIVDASHTGMSRARKI